MSKTAAVTIYHTHEFELELEASVNPGYPAPYCNGDHDHPHFGDPGDPGEVDAIQVALDGKKIEALKKIIIRHDAPPIFKDLTKGQLAGVVTDIFLVFDPEFLKDMDDRFFEQYRLDGKDAELDEADRAYDDWKDRQWEADHKNDSEDL